jgi:hypothetical protein
MYRWKGYLDFLPKYLPGMPMFWTEEDLRHLQGTSTLMKMRRGSLYGFVEPPCHVSLKFHSFQGSCFRSPPNFRA